MNEFVAGFLVGVAFMSLCVGAILLWDWYKRWRWTRRKPTWHEAVNSVLNDPETGRKLAEGVKSNNALYERLNK